jgi:hypothetical protein
MKKLLPLLFLAWALGVSAQNDSTNKDAIFNRPFIPVGKTPVAVGGYVEGNTNYFARNGISEGFSMELRRFNEEINLETALLDFELHPAFTLRGGILLAPIGAFNQNHDAPKWDFVERPLVSTQIIPSTLSEIGFGAHGRVPGARWTFTYEAYLVNGLGDGVINNADNRTFLPAGKSNDMVAEDNNGTPMMTGRLAIKRRKIGEIGFSAYGGVYNKFRDEGLTIDEKRTLFIKAFDFNFSIGKLQWLGEAALVDVQVPEAAKPFFGARQWGGFTDLTYPIVKRKILRWNEAKINAALRLEYVDFNTSHFRETNDNIRDEVSAIGAGFGFRPSGNTVIRANYRYSWITDIFGNPPVREAGFQFGLASYF